ncbi:unnamed protein product [Brachionus calyciflorus]|uniref:C-type lectin domain-containing protein n=1 Tax=Brachionus calyciflorus TaxID=104777 RepID=A0A814RMR1_9BILA|nr:unnamed protein product [Brachionus calyciflorus]
MDKQCYYVKYEKRECSLFTEQAEIKTYLLSEKTIYEKTVQNVMIEECSNSTTYWSLSTNSCLRCKTGFIKYSEMQNFCFHDDWELRNFDESKTYCESKGAFLFRPKTQKERLFFTQKFPNFRVFVDSRITSSGEQYKWPGGSYVCGFSNRQPDNLLTLLESVLEIVSSGKFNDIKNSKKKI